MNFQISAHYFYFASFAGTFTLSNLGMFGVDRFDAIIPPGTVGVSTQYEYFSNLPYSLQEADQFCMD